MAEAAAESKPPTTTAAPDGFCIFTREEMDAKVSGEFKAFCKLKCAQCQQRATGRAGGKGRRKGGPRPLGPAEVWAEYRKKQKCSAMRPAERCTAHMSTATNCSCAKEFEPICHWGSCRFYIASIL